MLVTHNTYTSAPAALLAKPLMLCWNLSFIAKVGDASTRSRLLKGSGLNG